MPQPHLRGKSPQNPLNRRLVGHQRWFGRLKRDKFPSPERSRTPVGPARSLNAVLTTPSRLTFYISRCIMTIDFQLRFRKPQCNVLERQEGLDLKRINRHYFVLLLHRWDFLLGPIHSVHVESNIQLDSTQTSLRSTTTTNGKSSNVHACITYI
jgi:hypothetical protein